MEQILLASPLTTSAQLACSINTGWSAPSALLRQVSMTSALATVIVLSSPIELEDTPA